MLNKNNWSNLIHPTRRSAVQLNFPCKWVFYSVAFIGLFSWTLTSVKMKCSFPTEIFQPWVGNKAQNKVKTYFTQEVWGEWGEIFVVNDLVGCCF